MLVPDSGPDENAEHVGPLLVRDSGSDEDEWGNRVLDDYVDVGEGLPHVNPNLFAGFDAASLGMTTWTIATIIHEL